MHGAGALADDGLHALAHGAQVHRHVRRVGDKLPAAAEHGAREIQAFLDVDRIGGVLQGRSHLLGD